MDFCILFLICITFIKEQFICFACVELWVSLFYWFLIAFWSNNVIYVIPFWDVLRFALLPNYVFLNKGFMLAGEKYIQYNCNFIRSILLIQLFKYLIFLLFFTYWFQRVVFEIPFYNSEFVNFCFLCLETLSSGEISLGKILASPW